MTGEAAIKPTACSGATVLLPGGTALLAQGSPLAPELEVPQAGRAPQENVPPTCLALPDSASNLSPHPKANGHFKLLIYTVVPCHPHLSISRASITSQYTATISIGLDV